MRKHFALLSILALTLAIACSKPKTELAKQQSEQALSDPTLMKPTTTRNPDQPEWVDNADRAGRLTAVGIANPNPIDDIQLQRTQATNRGMAALAMKLQVNVDALYEEVMAHNVTGEKKLNQQALVETKSTLRNLVVVKMRGAKAPSFWTDRQTGKLFVLCQLNDDSSMSILREAAANQPALREAIQNLDATKAKQQ